MSKALDNINKLDDVIYVTEARFGARPSGSSADAAINSAAFIAAINALSIGSQYGAVRRRKLRIPAGVYYLDSNLVFTETGYGGGFSIEGDGDLNTILLFTTTTGDALTVAGNYFQFRDFGVFGTSARQAGSGSGIVCNAGLSTTSYRGEFTNIRVYGHAGHGFLGTRLEHHKFSNFFVGEVNGVGFELTGGAGQSSWNELVNIRTQGTGLNGIVLSSTTQHNTLTNPEALDFGRTDTSAIGISVNGRGNILTNCDSENPQNITGATNYTGVKLVGSRHVLRGGYIGDINKGVDLVSATLCEIDQPTFTNGLSGVTAANAVISDNNCSLNKYSLPTSATNFTAILSPLNGRTGDVIQQGGVFGRTSTFTASLQFGGAAVGMTISSQSSRYTAIGKLVFFEIDITLSAKGSSTGSAKITGLPFTSASGARAMVDAFVVSGGSGLTNLDASAVSPSSVTIDLRSQGAAGLAELTDANFTNTTRIIVSGTYTMA